MAEEEKKGLSKEELDELNNDLERAKAELVSKSTQDQIAKAKEEARKEAESEFKAKHEIEVRNKEIEELKKRLELKEKEAAERLDALKRKVDEMQESQAIVSTQDPFRASEKRADNLTDAQLDSVEERSAEAFFGPDYQRAKFGKD
jgi:predicted esterase YcpF (UPF0227 family)